jgi:hypothetical protein
MKKLALTIVLALFASSTIASPWDVSLCPPYVGTFAAVERGVLAVTIVKENDKAVTPHTERLANPLHGKEAEALIRRGAVQFNAHVDKKSGLLFVHWETLRASK